jgi:hypothetical protein
MSAPLPKGPLDERYSAYGGDTTPIPLPEKPLGTHCSALKDNVLYTFSENAFQSLQLTRGSKWQQLPQKIGTNGAACVVGHRGTPKESLYIVGGSTRNTDNGYQGLQRWVFNEKNWETLPLPTRDIFNLTNHGATFLESTQQIMVFGGTAYPEPDIPSAKTFLINTVGSPEINSVRASDPLFSPIVLPWGDGALILGGNTDNKVLKTFSVSSGWGKLDIMLDKGIPSGGSAAASLVDGDDGSQALMIFDMSVSPSQVEVKILKQSTREKLRLVYRSLEANSTTVELTADSWPKYNSEGAPKETRTDISLAYDGGLVVISGGNEQGPILLFNARTNAWVSAQKVLGIEKQNRDQDPLSPTFSAGVSPDLTEPPDSNPSGRLSTVKLLFAVLGTILGISILIALLLFLLKRRRQKVASKARANSPEAEGRMSFQDRGASFMKEAGGSDVSSPSIGYPCPQTRNTDSWSHMQKYDNLVAVPAPLEVPREAPLPLPARSPISSLPGIPPIHKVGSQGVVIHGSLSPSGSGKSMSAQTYGKERSSGWSKYFSGISTTNIAGGTRRRSAVRSSVYSDFDLHPNPNLYNAGAGVEAGGDGGKKSNSTSLPLGRTTSNKRMEHRCSDISMSSIGGDSFSSGITDSMDDTDKPLWSPVDLDQDEDRRDDRLVAVGFLVILRHFLLDSLVDEIRATFKVLITI